MEAFAEAPATRLDLQLCRVLKSLGINIQVCRIDLVSLAKTFFAFKTLPFTISKISLEKSWLLFTIVNS